MTVSYPSRPVTTIDIPDVEGFNATFNYIFFVPDEGINESGRLTDKLASLQSLRPSETVDTSTITALGTRIPRYVRFDFKRSIAKSNVIKNEFLTRPPDDLPINALINGVTIIAEKEKNFIAKNFNRIVTETSFFKDDFVGVNFQDDNIDGKLYALISGSVERKLAVANQQITSDIEREKLNLFERLSRTNSLLDKAKAFSEIVGVGNQNNNFIVDALNNINRLGVSFYDIKERKEIINQKFDKAKKASLRAQISRRIWGQIVKGIADDPMSVYSDELSSVVQPALSYEKQAVSDKNPLEILEEEYDQKVECGLGIVSTSDVQNFDPTIEVIGYIIDKEEILSNGDSVIKEPIFIENNITTVAVDNKIRYGSRYAYSIRSVAFVKFQASSVDTAEVIEVGLLVASKNSPKITVDCIENVPPPHPDDFNIIWDYQKLAPYLTWNLPASNRQQDIKKFQIFRRKTIQEPFELIKEFDFDNSIVKVQNPETPDINLITKTEQAITSYYDLEFTKDNKYIYSICSVDAHGLSSNYSMQFEISFDRFKNKMKKILISNSGAPKSYPNMYLKTLDTFVDTIKNSGHTRLNVYFDPEFLDVKTNEGNSLNLLSTDKTNGSYRINFINVDYQKQENLKIEIDDLRKNETIVKNGGT